MNGENHRGKTPSSDFKVTIPKNPLLSITSDYKYKESYQTLCPIPKYQPTVEPLSQYSIGLYCSGNLSLDAQIPVHD